MRKPSPTTPEPAKPAIKKIQVLEPQRRKAVCVMTARLPDKKDVYEALDSMDSQALNRDQIELLLMNAPSAEERQLLTTAQAEHTIDEMNVWDSAEDFLITMLGIPQYELRLQVWNFENLYQERFDSVAGAQACISAGCDAILESQTIRHLLGIVLCVGNYLNGGTPRGRADGFAIETLVQMRTVKMSQGERSGTLVDYLVQQMEKQYPGTLEGMFDPCGGESASIKSAARYKLGDLTEETVSFKAAAEQLLRAARASEEPVLNEHGQHLASCVTQLQELQMRLQISEKRYAQLGDWFAMEDKSSKRPAVDEFFGTWDRFMADVKQALEKLKLQEQQRQAALRQRRSTPRRSSVACVRDLQNYEGDEVGRRPCGTPRRSASEAGLQARRATVSGGEESQPASSGASPSRPPRAGSRCYRRSSSSGGIRHAAATADGVK